MNELPFSSDSNGSIMTISHLWLRKGDIHCHFNLCDLYPRNQEYVNFLTQQKYDDDKIINFLLHFLSIIVIIALFPSFPPAIYLSFKNIWSVY
jgi:hypothetical protein